MTGIERCAFLRERAKRLVMFASQSGFGTTMPVQSSCSARSRMPKIGSVSRKYVLHGIPAVRKWLAAASRKSSDREMAWALASSSVFKRNISHERTGSTIWSKQASSASDCRARSMAKLMLRRKVSFASIGISSRCEGRLPDSWPSGEMGFAALSIRVPQCAASRREYRGSLLSSRAVSMGALTTPGPDRRCFNLASVLGTPLPESC